VRLRTHIHAERLLALCVHADGTIGEGYGKAILENQGGALPDDLDMHAAVERLKCHQYFGADLPADGGTAALTPQVARSRNKARANRTATNGSRPVCPTCDLMLPMSGKCDNCA
jgi:hypothetical protein